MERMLKDYLVEHTSENEIFFSVTCTACGNVWKSTPQIKKGTKPEDERNIAAQEAARMHHVCNFCGRPVCKDCFTDVEGISLCMKCGRELLKRLDAQ